MRTFHIAALAMLAAVSESVAAHSMMESFDTSILNARSGLPNTVPMVARANNDNSSMKMQRRSEMVRVTKKREEGGLAMAADVQKRGDDGADEECEADEDDSNDDEEEDCEEEEDEGDDDEDCDEEDASNDDKSSDAPVLPTSSIRNAAAVLPSTTAASAPSGTAAPASAPAAGGDKTSGPVQKPSNIADESFTPSEGCIRYHTVLEGEVCLGVLDGSKDLGLTLDQFYCLNPGIKEGCSNLETGKAYCTGYSGEWPQ